MQILYLICGREVQQCRIDGLGWMPGQNKISKNDKIIKNVKRLNKNQTFNENLQNYINTMKVLVIV